MEGRIDREGKDNWKHIISSMYSDERQDGRGDLEKRMWMPVNASRFLIRKVNTEEKER
jgi:hypothetical protein